MANSLADWVRTLRATLRMTQIEFSEAVGVTQPTVSRWERGNDLPNRSQLRRLYDMAVGANHPVDVLSLLLGSMPASQHTMVPVAGYVGGGAEVFPFDDHALGQGMEEVDPPAWFSGPLVAVRVKGDSMYPIRDGWLLFYSRDQDGVPDGCVSQLCVVKVADDGPTFIKELRQGRRKNLFTLHSWNAQPIEDVRLEWAARVIDIRPA